MTFTGIAVLLAGLIGGPTTFVDRTVPAGINVVFSASGYQNDHYAGGGAVGDFDGDGDQDLYVPTGGAAGLPDRLYINNGDGTFTDRAAEWGLVATHSAKGSAVGDYDGDGDLDLFVTSAGPTGDDQPCHHKLYRNEGGSGFVDVALAAGVRCTTTTTQDGWGAAFGDYDLDGDLDLFVAGFAPANDGSRLFRNDGDGTFTDVTSAIGFFAGTPIGMSAFTPRFADMDGDFYPEMLLVGDFGTSRYFRNDGDGTFTDVTASASTSLEENGMGGTIGDFDGDRRLDWYVTSIYLPSLSWTGNKLYLNAGPHSYDEVAAAAGVDDGGYGWGAAAVDFDHDGRLDIAETNGGLGGDFANEPSYLWMNAGDGTFSEEGASTGFVHTGEGRGLVHLDYDNDGDQDLVVFGRLEPVTLFRNDLQGPNRRWLRVFLDTDQVPGLAPGGIGARVFVDRPAGRLLRYMSNGDNFLSQSELSAHFGLGGDEEVALEVHWPNGTTSRIEELDTDRTVTVIAHGPVVCSPAPLEVEGLTLSRAGDDIEFHWDDVPLADDYRILGASDPSAPLEWLVAESPSGLPGASTPIPPGTKFFRVTARRGNCQGP